MILFLFFVALRYGVPSEASLLGSEVKEEKMADQFLTFSWAESTPSSAQNFFIFQVEMECNSGQERKLFHPANFCLFS